MRSRLSLGCLPPFLALGLPVAAWAYTLAPSVLQLRPAGGESSAFLQLANNQAEPVALELTVNEHRKDLDGKTVEGPAADHEFLIYPAQVVLMPGEEIAVQVRWISEPLLPAEKAYTLVARQVRIPEHSSEEGEAGGVRVRLRVLLNYEARIYVSPRGAKPALGVESVAELPAPPGNESDPGAAQLEVILANLGTAHQSLRNLTLAFTPLDPAGLPVRRATVTVAARNLPGATPHLLAGDRRRLRLPRPAGLPPGPVRVTVSE